MRTNSQLESICGTYSSEDDVLYIWQNNNNVCFFMFNGMVLKSAKTISTANKYLKEFVKKYNLVKEVED